jgi:FHS family L-fucose permease-like MFS transporter
MMLGRSIRLKVSGPTEPRGRATDSPMAIAQVSNSPEASTAQSASTRAALIVVTSLFFMWGFVTALNDVLIPHLKSIFDLNYAKASLIQFAFFAAYFLFSIPAARLIDSVGYKRAMVTGVLVMGAGALLFMPAATVPSYPLFLGALMVLACGITILQVAANPYVAVLGPSKTASSRLNLSQAFNSLGTTVAPLLGGYLILNAAAKSVAEIRQMAPDALQAYRVHEAASVKLPYLVIGLALLVLGFLISTFRLPPIPGAEHHKGDPTDSLWKYRHLILGVVGIFVYVGAEVSIGSFLINYFSEPNIGNISQADASKYLSSYWFCAMIGRFIGSAILQKVRTGKLLGIAAIAACLLVLVSMASSGHVAMWSMILIGLFNSVMFPSIFTLGIADLGPRTGDGSGLLIMAIVGGAIVPLAVGALADRIGLQHSFILPAICYLYIVYYAFKGSRIVTASEHAAG